MPHLGQRWEKVDLRPTHGDMSVCQIPLTPHSGQWGIWIVVLFHSSPDTIHCILYYTHDKYLPHPLDQNFLSNLYTTYPTFTSCGGGGAYNWLLLQAERGIVEQCILCQRRVDRVKTINIPWFLIVFFVRILKPSFAWMVCSLSSRWIFLTSGVATFL